MKLSDLVFTSLFILADAAAAGRVKNATAVPNILNVRAKLAIENLLFGTSMPAPNPTTTPRRTSAASSTCIGSTPGWKDLNDRGCDWYEENDYPGCPVYGSYIVSLFSEVENADDNCCYCFGTGVSVFDLVISGLI